MRAVLIGVMNAVLAAGAASASDKPCRLDGAELVSAAEGPAEMKRPDLVGQHFRITRVASWTKRVPGRTPSETLDIAEIAVAIDGKSGRFVISQGYTPHSSPWIIATSWSPKEVKSINLAGTEKYEIVNWTKRDRKAEAAYFCGPIASFYVYNGPFSGMILSPVRCR